MKQISLIFLFVVLALMLSNTPALAKFDQLLAQGENSPQANPPDLNLPPYEIAVQYGEWLGGQNSTMDITLSGVGEGYDVSDGVYPGWCIQYQVYRVPNSAILYSSYDPSAPPDIVNLAWNEINYVLNHKQGENLDVQKAIWILLGYDVTPTPEAQAMADEANAHPDFIPGPGELVAVIVYSDGMNPNPQSYQEAIIEVTVPQTEPPIIDVVKTANPISMPEPGGEVQFSVTVNNNSGATDPVTINSLVDDIHGDLNGQGTCSVPQTIQPGGSYSCTFPDTVEGNAGYIETDTVTASGTDDEGTPVEDSDDATVTITDVLPNIDVLKTADPVVLIEPGGNVTFTVVVTNTSPVDELTLTSLVDDIHGDLNGQGTCAVPQTLAVGESYTCAFSAMVQGAAGDTETDTVTASGHDDEGTSVEDSDNATVTIVAQGTPIIHVVKTADPEVLEEPGGVVTFTVTVTNNSGPDDPVTITSLVDDIHGDLNGQGTCSVPQTIQPGGSYTCQFPAMVDGVAGDTETDTVTASGHDDENTPVEDSDDATVIIVHADGIPVIDVVKEANPTNLPVPGGVVTFTVTVTNNSGPEDPVTITSLVDDIHGDLNGQGTCSVPQTLQPGASYTCQFTAMVEGQSGYSETDTVTAKGHDDDGYPVDDSDDATVHIGQHLIYLPYASNEKTVIETAASISLGYEDLDIQRDDMDYDYNDWVTVINTELKVDQASGNLYTIAFTFEPQARGGVRTHTPHILIPANSFASDGVSTLTIYDENGNVISSKQLSFIAAQDNDFAVLDCTCDAFPKAGQVINAFEEQPYEATMRTSRLTIEFYTPGPFNEDYMSPEQIAIPHGEGLFFDPYLVVHERDLVIHQGDPRLLSIPDVNYDWPEERVRLDKVYPGVTGEPPFFNFAPQWWTQHNTCVYGDGIKCPLSPDFNSYVPE